MPVKKGNNKRGAAKAAASSADAEVFNNGEKEEAEKLAIDEKKLPNGNSLTCGDDALESTKFKSLKRNNARTKNAAPDLEAVEPPAKKPVAKGRGKKKANENKVIEKEVSTQHETEVVEETNEKEELKTRPEGRGGAKKADTKTKKAIKAKENKKDAENANGETSRQIDETAIAVKNTKVKKATKAKEKKKEASIISEEANGETADQVEETEITEKNTKGIGGRKRKQDSPKALEQMETKEAEGIKQEINGEVSEEKVGKKYSRNSKKIEETTTKIEPQKKKGKFSKKDKTVESSEIEIKVKDELKPGVKEKKTVKRGRGMVKATNEIEEMPDTNAEPEEVLPKKRSRKGPSVEKEMVKQKPKKGRGKKSDKEEDVTESVLQEKEVKNSLNGQTEQDKDDKAEESHSSNIKTERESVSPVTTAAAKVKGGRKRAAPSANNKKASLVTADDDEKLENGVDNAKMENAAVGSKSSKTKRGKTDAPLLNSTVTKYNQADFDLPPPSDGQTIEEPRFNFKISSWNVAGLRSWLKKDGLTFLNYEQPDIFCMQETKCSNEQLPEEVVPIPGYHPYWLCMPGGYAGVAIYSKIMPIHVEYGIGNKDFDNCGRIITAEYEKFFLINVYVPNSGRKLVNLDARMKWEELFQQFIKNLDARKPVVICGDMNVSHQEQDLANPKTNTRSAGFTKEERDKMTELLGIGLIDTFRHLYPRRKGAYTYWTYMSNARSRNVGWRLDYFIVSERFIKRVVDNCIRSQCMGSDHCPITLFLKL